MKSLDFIERKYFHSVLFENGIEGAIANDGLVVMFDLNEVAHLLSKYDEDKEGWFFNSTHDRYIAEKRGKRVVANPQFMWKELGPIAIEDKIL